MDREGRVGPQLGSGSAIFTGAVVNGIDPQSLREFTGYILMNIHCSNSVKRPLTVEPRQSPWAASPLISRKCEHPSLQYRSMVPILPPTLGKNELNKWAVA